MSTLIRLVASSLFTVGLLASVASAQTTVVLNVPDTHIVDAFVRAGTYSNTVYNNSVLVTKANTDLNYHRHALLRFDTETFVPANAAIQSASLTLVLKSSESDTRTLNAYRLTSDWDEKAATWYRRKSTGTLWTTPGGDLGTSYASATVGTTRGTRVTFDVTRLVQENVNGVHGSRKTQIALVDPGATSSRSFKEFYSSEATDPATRPQLKITYATAAPVAVAAVTSLKVMTWNIHYGLGTDGAYGLDKYVDWIVRINPDLVALNEVEKYVSGHGNEDQPALLAAKLQARTGKPWYYHFAQRFGQWTSKGSGNLILSRFPIEATSQLAMSYGRSAALATVTVNGRTVNFISTHLANKSDGSTARAVQIQQLMPWARSFSEQRIVAGDFNVGLVNVPYMANEYQDGWSDAAALGKAIDFVGNTRWGATHDYKIDFAFESKGAQALKVSSAQVFDIRGANGVMPSDHKPLLITYSIQ